LAAKTIKFVVVNAHCNAEKEKQAVQDLIKKFTDKPYSLKPEDIIFTSMIDPPKYEYSVARETILDLFKLSNLFIFPTVTECCPLVLLEAAATNNLIIYKLSTFC
jgi:hypothetical protein